MLEFVAPARAPGKELSEHLFDRRLGIDAARIDREAGAFGRKPALGFRQAELVAREIDQVGRIFSVMNREGGIDPDWLGIFPQQPRTDAVERAGPAQRVGHDSGLVAHHLARDALDPAGHLGRRAPRKCHQQDTARIGVVGDQMRHAVGQRVGLAGSGAGNHQKRRADMAVGGDAVLDRTALFRIERIQIWSGQRSQHESFPLLAGRSAILSVTATRSSFPVQLIDG